MNARRADNKQFISQPEKLCWRAILPQSDGGGGEERGKKNGKSKDEKRREDGGQVSLYDGGGRITSQRFGPFDWELNLRLVMKTINAASCRCTGS